MVKVGLGFSKLVLIQSMLVAVMYGKGEVEIGKALVGGEVRYLRAENGDLTRLENGERHNMNRPVGRGEINEIEALYDGISKKLLALTDAGWLLVTKDDGTVWNDLTLLPDSGNLGFGSIVERLAIPLHRKNFIVWMGAHSVWTSRDGGETFQILSALPAEGKRMVFNGEDVLGVVTQRGVSIGQLRESGASLIWDVKTKNLDLGKNENVYFYEGSEFAVVSTEEGKVKQAVWMNMEDSEEASSHSRRGPKLSLDEIPALEFSTRNAHNFCKYEFLNTKTWRVDNYWDINSGIDSRGIPVGNWVDGQMRQVGREDRNCHWVSTFCPGRVVIFTADRKRTLTSGTINARITVFIGANRLPQASIRSFALNFIRSGDPRNTWVSIVQGARHTTSCEIAIRTTRITEPVGANHRTVAFQVTGSNPSCPIQAVNTIVCGGSAQGARSNSTGLELTLNSKLKDGELPSGLLLLPMNRAGVGECALTHTSPSCD